jgi:hypothetical protein
MDAEEQQFARSPLLNAGVIALAVIAVPYYLMRTRGLRPGLYGMGIFLAVAVAYSVLEYAGEYSAYLFKR